MTPMLAGSSTRALSASTSRCSCGQPNGDSGNCPILQHHRNGRAKTDHDIDLRCVMIDNLLTNVCVVLCVF
jgi:hypothetical protein